MVRTAPPVSIIVRVRARDRVRASISCKDYTPAVDSGPVTLCGPVPYAVTLPMLCLLACVLLVYLHV